MLTPFELSEVHINLLPENPGPLHPFGQPGPNVVPGLY